MSKFIKSERDRRALMLGATLLLPILLVVYVGRPLLASFKDTRANVTVQRDILSREMALVREASSFPDLFWKADSALRAVMPRLFTEQDELLATAALKQYVEGVARSSSVYLLRSVTQPALPQEHGLTLLTVEITAESDLEGMLNLLNRLENGPRIVKVDRLTLSAGPAQSASARNETALAMSAFISGYGIDTTAVRSAATPPAAVTTTGSTGENEG